MKSRRHLGIIASTLALLLLSPARVLAQAADQPAATEAQAAPAEQQRPRRTLLPRRGGKVDVSEAARRLQQARLARKQGLEPRPGEFTRDNGARTLNYRYWQRQERLRIAVEQAQRRSLHTMRLASQTTARSSEI